MLIPLLFVPAVPKYVPPPTLTCDQVHDTCHLGPDHRWRVFHYRFREVFVSRTFDSIELQEETMYAFRKIGLPKCIRMGSLAT